MKKVRRNRISLAKCRERIVWLGHKLRRPVSPKDIVADAKKKDSPYHYWFTWDLQKAAYKRWLDEARTLIGRIKVVYHDGEGKAVSVREYVHLLYKEPATHRLRGGYIPRVRAMTNKDLTSQCLETAKKELQAFKDRWRTFVGIEATFPHVDMAIVALDRRLRSSNRKIRKSS